MNDEGMDMSAWYMFLGDEDTRNDAQVILKKGSGFTTPGTQQLHKMANVFKNSMRFSKFSSVFLM